MFSLSLMDVIGANFDQLQGILESGSEHFGTSFNCPLKATFDKHFFFFVIAVIIKHRAHYMNNCLPPIHTLSVSSMILFI